MEYPKVNSLWKREGWYFDQGKKKSPDYQKGRQSFIIGYYSQPEFGNIKKWRVDEKIDGTNIRIFFMQKDSQRLIPDIMGRTSAAQIPTNLFSFLQRLATWENFDKALSFKEPNFEVILFGEGYGPKIQSCGGNYRKDVGFILFDVIINGWWLKREDVQDIAIKLDIPMVPDLGVMTAEEIVEFVKSKPLSKCSHTTQMMEGIVARSDPLMLFRNGKPIMWKLKCKEFK